MRNILKRWGDGRLTATVDAVTPAHSAEITRLLKAWSAGDESARDRLAPILYRELHGLARRYMRREPAGLTLQTTALVNEAYIRLAGAGGVNWQDRTHFFAVSAQVMRRILVDSARARHAEKRGRPEALVSLDELPVLSPVRGPELIALDDALEALAKESPRKAQMIELRFFGGLSVEECAEALSVHPNTVIRDWSLARAWLKHELACEAREATGM